MCIYRHERNQIFILLRSYLHECGKLLILCAIRGRLNICQLSALRGILPIWPPVWQPAKAPGAGDMAGLIQRGLAPQIPAKIKSPFPSQKFAKKQKGKNQLYKSSIRSPHHQFYFGNPIDNQIYLVYIKVTQEVLPMQINKAIRSLMKEKNISLISMAKAIGKQRGNDVSSRLLSPNMTFDKAVEMLDVLGYEVVIQERKPGARRADQIVIDQKES